MAKSARGLCAVLLGDDVQALRRDVRTRFPDGVWNEDERDTKLLARRVADLVERPAEQLDVPLDPQGSPFQRAVWKALLAIPAGTTTTYTALARRVGRPNAVRAVAGACAANPLALLIPCHRVVRSDGNLAGYRWGLERKRALLAREGSEKAASRLAGSSAPDLTATPGVAFGDPPSQGGARRE